MTPEQQTEQMMTDVRNQLDSARIDLDAFLACSGEERGRRWRLWYSAADKADLVRQMLTRRHGEWCEAEIAEWVTHYDIKWGDGPLESEAAILGALEDRLSGATGREATATRNAISYFRAGVRPEILPAGGFFLPSQSGGEGHILTRSGGAWDCSCKAGDKAHWALTLMAAIEEGIDRLADELYVPTVRPAPAPLAPLGQRLAAARRRCQEAA